MQVRLHRRHIDITPSILHQLQLPVSRRCRIGFLRAQLLRIADLHATRIALLAMMIMPMRLLSTCVGRCR